MEKKEANMALSLSPTVVILGKSGWVSPPRSEGQGKILP